MELMTELFEVVSSLDSRDQCFTQILRACADHQALALKPQNKLQPIIGHINRKLNTPSSRADGLALLKSFLPQCSDDVFIESAVSWMLQCIKGIEGNSKQKTGQISYETLELLLELSGKLPELTKPVANTVVPKLLEQLQSTPQQISWAALQCLEVLMRNYGGPCGPNKNVLEKFILRFVDDENSHLVLAASRCASLLPLVGGGGTGGSNHRAAWLSLQQQLCAAMSQVLDELFQNITEIQSVPVVSSQKLAIPAISENNPTSAVHRLTTRFTNIAQLLQSMFRAEFPVAKAVLPDTMFGLLCRGLAVSCKTLGRKVSSETLTVSFVLPQIHLALLRVLRSLIACCGSTLLQYGSLICKLLLQTLKWTSVDSWCYGMERPYGRLRVEACNALGDWLICAKGGSCVELHADQLVVVLRSDIQTARTTVTLTVHAPTRKQLSKQQRKALAKKQAEHGSGAGSSTANTGGNRGRSRLVEQTANQGPCRAALRALQWIIRASGPFLQPSIHKTLQETVLLLLLEVQRASSPHEYPLPYSVPACRLELYSLLHALTLEPHPGWPSPTQYALHTLAVGQRDPNLQVTGFCTVALSSVLKKVTIEDSDPSPIKEPATLDNMEEEQQGGTVEGSSQTLPNVESPTAKKIRVELANEEETYTSLNGIEDENKKGNGPIVNRSADKEVIADEEDMLASFVDIVNTESVSKTINSAKSIVDG